MVTGNAKIGGLAVGGRQATVKVVRARDNLRSKPHFGAIGRRVKCARPTFGRFAQGQFVSLDSCPANIHIPSIQMENGW